MFASLIGRSRSSAFRRSAGTVSTSLASSRFASCQKRARGLALGFGLVQCHGGANERLQRLFINLSTLTEIDGTPDVASEPGVERADWALSRAALGQG